MSSNKHVTIGVEPTGAVRLSAALQPEESRHDLFIRDVEPAAARALAIELLQAADEADAVQRHP
ncbi:hypothetical protein ABZ401_19245 [Streptomyces sp. NPDC005892]|uniref:hypothetical protein n=1 Tax=Streptomyces sp. NPDC005892 TaxID=3155593 RepID=UPI0033DC3D31